jgi:hypothetical protein
MRNGICVEHPRRWEVFQREAGAARVPVEVKGVSGETVTALAVDERGRVVAQCHCEVRDGTAAGAMEVPAGGWYWLALAGGKRRRRTVPFGVGDVFVIAGQSNAAGHGDGFIADRSRLVAMRGEPGDWALADHPERLPTGTGTGSAWPTLGELLASYDHVQIGFIMVAVGGTSTEQWQPAGDFYPVLQRALSGRRVRAVLWHQGESDPGPGSTTERTYQNMVTLIEQSRADAGWRVPWYVAVATYPPDTPNIPEQNRQAVRAAQAALSKVGLTLPGPDTDIYVPGSMRYDGVHFGQVGLVVHALLWFRALVFPET